MTGPQLVACAAAWGLVLLAVAVIAGVPAYRIATIAVQVALWVGIVALVVWAVRDDDRARRKGRSL